MFINKLWYPEHFMRFCIFILSFIFTALSTYAQEYIINNYNPDNDNSLSAVYSIAQDRSGFIWFSSGRGGVFRFDGKNFQHYTQKEGFTNSQIKKVICDSKGNLWFCTTKSKLYQYKNGSFFECFPEKKESIIDIIDYNGILLLAIKNNLFSFNGHSFNKIRTFPRPILSLRNDFQGNTFILTSGGYLFCYSMRDNKLDKVYNNRLLNCFYVDRKGNKWLGISNKVIIVYENKFQQIVLPDSLGKTLVRDIIEDSDGCMWFSSTEGLFRFKGIKPEYIKISKYDIDNVCGSIFEDREKNLWIGSAGCLSKISKNNLLFLDNEITSLKGANYLFENKNGDIWFSAHNKLIKYNSKSLKKIDIHWLQLPANISAGMEDRNGSLWFVSGNLLVNYDWKKFDKLSMPSKARSFTAKVMIQDKKGHYYLLCDGNLIWKYDRKIFSDFSLKKDSAEFCNLLYNKFGISWFYSGGNSLKVFNGKIFKDVPIKYDSEGLKLPVVEDKQFLWAVISSGKNSNSLVQIDKMYGLVKKFNKDNGMPSGRILSIKYYCHGDIWFFIRGNGFARFDMTEYRDKGKAAFYEYPYNHGYKDVLLSSSFTDKNENIWIRSFSGWVILNPQNFERYEPKAPQTELLSLRLFLGSHSLSKFIQNVEQISLLPKNLTLPYNENYLTFNFSAPVFTNADVLNYTHKLEGFDKEWSPLNKSNEVTYTNLPPGEYTFKVKANMGDATNFGEAAEYSFVIGLPFWKTWWFFLCTISVFSAMYFSAIKFRAGRIQKKTLEKLVNLRTKELQEEKERVENINIELEKSQYRLHKINEIQTRWLHELSDSEQNLREMNQNKDKFFSIISHDLKSPFNSIIRYTDSFLEKYNHMNAEQIIEYSSILNKSVRQIYDHIEKLLDWSRVQTGRVEFIPIRYEINIQINEIISLHSGNISKKGIRLINCITDTLFVFADENMVRSILNNLISNAVKFTHEGGRIIIDAVSYEYELEICISDNGIGINEDDMPKLFKIDHQFTTPGTSNEKGTGLGLILSKELVEKNGGRISALSTPGKGSTFSFTLPLFDRNKT